MSVLVYTENWDGKFKKLSYELVSYGYGLSKQINSSLHVISIGIVEENELMELAKYGVSEIHHVKLSDNTLDSKYFTQIISYVANQINASTIILANNNSGKSLAPRLSVRMNAGLVTNVISLPTSTSPFIIRKKLFTGKAIASIEVLSDKQVLTLSQNSYGITENPVTSEVIFSELPAGLSKSGIEIKDVNKVSGKVLLTDAEIVVSGGRGMKGPENWKPIEELAEVLGGATACSRPVSDEGWRPHSEHTGQTGKIIAPNLYFAFGISGAIQHVAGVSSSKVIVAVNKDPEAPIFEVADYGIVGDALKIVPELVNEVKKIKSE